MHLAPAASDPATLQGHRPAVSDPFAHEVLATVAAAFAVAENDLLVHSRRPHNVAPRLAAMYFARLLTSCSLIELGALFGGRCHTTVLRAFRRCRHMIEQDAGWAERMDGLLIDLTERRIGRT
jgi:chromosomal replication initiation ATPase DnaA